MQPTGTVKTLTSALKQTTDRTTRTALASAIAEQIKADRIRRIESIRAFGEDTIDAQAKIAHRLLMPRYSDVLRTLLGMN